jgi:hypothetical protein
MKKFLHPRLIPNPHKSAENSPEYAGGKIHLFGINLHLSYSKSEGTWTISNEDIISSEDCIKSLKALFESLDQNGRDKVFSDYSTIHIDDLPRLVKERIDGSRSYSYDIYSPIVYHGSKKALVPFVKKAGSTDPTMLGVAMVLNDNSKILEIIKVSDMSIIEVYHNHDSWLSPDDLLKIMS